jgi:2-methylcitrate dehydratase PrpD
MNPTVAERLVTFALEQARDGIPDDVSHEAKRLLLNQLKASVAATNHEAIKILHNYATSTGAGGQAHVLWLGTQTEAAKAALVNGALFEVLDFHDTYIPCFMHATSAVLPAVLAAAELGGQSGRDVITALALGMEVELACAALLMPTAYYRGYVPAGLVGGIGAAAACSLLAGLDEHRMLNAMGIAMCTAFGTYESVGSMTLSYITGATAASGLTAAQLAEQGFDAPSTAFEGDKGMLESHSDEPREKFEQVLESLGKTWRIHGQSYKSVPTETITHPPVECALALRERAAGRQVERLRFGVQPIVVEICDERMERFGDPHSELTARFDLCFCAAAAWQRGRFTLDEMREPAYTDPEILALRGRTELIADEARESFDGCSLEVQFTDGSTESTVVDAFLGSPGRRMTDDELSDIFRNVASDLLPPGRTDGILEAVWHLDKAANINTLMTQLKLQ